MGQVQVVGRGYTSGDGELLITDGSWLKYNESFEFMEVGVV